MIAVYGKVCPWHTLSKALVKSMCVTVILCLLLVVNVQFLRDSDKFVDMDCMPGKNQCCALLMRLRLRIYETS